MNLRATNHNPESKTTFYQQKRKTELKHHVSSAESESNASVADSSYSSSDYDLESEYNSDISYQDSNQDAKRKKARISYRGEKFTLYNVPKKKVCP